MFRAPLIAFLALASSAGASSPPPATAVCLDVNGQALPAACTAQASRLDKREDICLCSRGVRTEAPVCGPGERAPPEGLALNRVRREAGRDGSLVGDLFEGRPICVAQPRP